MELTREQRIRQKLYWFREAGDLGNVKLACRRLGISRKHTISGGTFTSKAVTTERAWLIAPAAPIFIPAPSRADGRSESLIFAKKQATVLVACGLISCARDGRICQALMASTRWCAGRGSSRFEPRLPAKSTSGATRCPCRVIGCRLISSLFPTGSMDPNTSSTRPLMIAHGSGFQRSTPSAATSRAKSFLKESSRRCLFPSARFRLTTTPPSPTGIPALPGRPRTSP